MKKIIFLLALIGLYGCNNDDCFSPVSEDVMTRSSNSDPYCFEPYRTGNTWSFDYQQVAFYDVGFNVSSYTELNGTATDLLPEVISKPDWVDDIMLRHIYFKISLMLIAVGENTMPSERTGTIVLRQPESGKILSIQVTQEGHANEVTVKINTITPNRFEFVLSSKYPVKGNISVSIPYIVYNTVSEMEGEAYMQLTNGTSTKSWLMDYSGAPIVCYYGDLTGYRLSPGTLYSSNGSFYDYVLLPYWQ